MLITSNIWPGDYTPGTPKFFLVNIEFYYND